MSTTKPTKTEDEDDGTTSTTVTNPQWNNVESIFKSPSSTTTTTTTIDNNGSSGLPMRKSPPRFLGKRNRNTSFDQQGGGISIKKTLSWALPTDDLHTNHQEDKASSSYVAPPVNPSRSPIIEDDDDDDDETFPIKFSLSNDYSTKDETCSLSEYLTDANFSISMMGPSPRGSPTMTSFLPGDVFPMEGGDGSPLLNIHGSDTFDFCDSNTKSFLESPPTIKNSSSCLSDQVAASSAAAAAAAASHVHHDLPPPRLPVGDGLISRSHSSDHHSTTQYNLSPRKSSNNDSPYRLLPDHRHHQEVHHGGGSGNGGPTQHLSPGQTIYNVASKSVGSPSTPYYHPPQQQQNNWNHHSSESHSTPLTTGAGVSSETSPEFNPPRSNLRESKYQATITVSTPHGNDDKSSMKNDDGSLKTVKHASSSSSSGGKIVTDPITPSPSGNTHNNIRQAVSDESSSPTEMAPTVHHPPPHRSYHHHPSSGGGRSGSYGGGVGYNNIDHHRGSHHQRWSDSLHMAPLPPYVQQQHHHQSHHAHARHPWQQQQAGGQQLNLPPALPSSGRGGGGLGYHHHNHHRHPLATTSYSGPYYHQATPDCATSNSIATPSTTTVPSLSLPNSNTQEQVVNNASTTATTAAVKVEEEEHAYWNKHYHLLHQFLLQYGHCNIPPNYGIGTHYETLYDWCVNQRAEYQKMCRYNSGGGGEEKEEGRSTMTPTRVRILTSMGFVWGAPLPPGRGTGTSHGGGGSRSSSSNKKSSSSYSSNWDKWIEMLKSFKSQHGHVDVPLKYEPNPALGTFVNRQRSEYRKYHTSKPTSITPQRISQLNTLGFTWSIRDTHTSWNERYQELQQFRNVNGHTNVPKIYNHNPSLGYWVNEQRFQYRRLIKNKSSSMNEEKIRLLNELDFKWSLRETNGSWDNWIKELKGYKSQHGDVDVPLKYKHNPALGAFVNRQRTEYRKLQQGLQSSLTQDRMASLNELDFKWTMRVSRTPWETRLDELIKFKEQHGHCNVPSTYPLNQPLAYWVFKQRGQYRIWQKRDYVVPGEKKQMCHMTPDRIRKLDEIGFEWNPPRRIK